MFCLLHDFVRYFCSPDGSVTVYTNDEGFLLVCGMHANRIPGKEIQLTQRATYWAFGINLACRLLSRSLSAAESWYQQEGKQEKYCYITDYFLSG